MKIITIISILFFILLFSQCTKDKPTPLVNYDKSSGIFVCNEGNFTYGNATLSFLDLENNSIENQVFYNANDFPLGDVCQSMVIKDEKGFIVINNSGKIYVINSSTFKHISTITGLISPRYIEFINDQKAYISDLYSQYITVFNPETFEKIDSIFVGNSTDKMVRYENYIFTNSWSYNDKIYVIDCTQDLLIDSILVTKQPNSIVLDNNNKLWILSDGGVENSSFGKEKAALTKINPTTFEIENIIQFPSLLDSPTELCCDKNGENLFFINNGNAKRSESNLGGVFQISSVAESLPINPLISAGEKLFYGLSIDSESSDIYVTDAIDYMQRGWLMRFSQNGEEIDSYKVGVIPGGICLKP